MEEITKKKLFDLIYIILIISLICFMIWVVTFLKGNAKECLENPIEYMENKNSGSSCYCINLNEHNFNADPFFIIVKD